MVARKLRVAWIELSSRDLQSQPCRSEGKRVDLVAAPDQLPFDAFEGDVGGGRAGYGVGHIANHVELLVDFVQLGSFAEEQESMVDKRGFHLGKIVFDDLAHVGAPFGDQDGVLDRIQDAAHDFPGASHKPGGASYKPRARHRVDVWLEALHYTHQLRGQLNPDNLELTS
ncbi:uncharacterized protein EHS24_002509 [Apiotrichum porosum]|uniref:Uncharacterized protein n=1 Tax=Apiotrichum porosum TaxID=105984 RepID=A0A427XH68_9TREE|nr:uncharacterized protein EHS24_002509 [Apiotrichum porosum]RSH78054.1 hypothetical protein EHS24_002509 [Apiotrichum porosum]